MIDGRELYGIEDELKALEAEESHKDSLQSITRALLEKAENQRKDIGKAYPVHHALCRTSKGLIRAWDHGKTVKVELYKKLYLRLWSILGTADLPKDIASQHDNESSQEIMEAEIVMAIYNIAFGDECEIPGIEDRVRGILEALWTKLGDPEADPALAALVETENQLVKEKKMKPKERKHAMSIPYQAWLSGAGDGIGEISKILESQLNDHNFSGQPAPDGDANKRLICQTVVTMRTIHEFLVSFEACYGQAINASRRRGFFNTFRGTVEKTQKEVRRWSDKVLDITLREACDAKLLAHFTQASHS